MSGGPTSGGFGMPYHRPSSSAAPPPPPTAPDTLRISVVSCANLKIKDRGFFGVGGSSDPFVQLVLGDEKMRTRTIKKDLNPRFEETFEVQLIGDGHARGRALTVPLEVTVWDEDLGGLKQDFIGKIAVDFVAPDVVRYQLCDRKGKPDVGRGTVELKLELVDTSCQWFKEPLDDVTKPPNEFRIALLRGRKLKAMDGILCSTSDPYVVLTVDSPECVAEFRTATRMRTLSPVWDEEFAFEASQDATVHLTVYDYDVGRKDDVLDHARLSLQQLVARPPGGKPTKHAQAAVCRWLPLDRRSEVLVVAQWRYSARIAAPFRGAHVDALAFAFPEALRGDVSNLYDDYDGDVQSACAALTLKYVGGAGRSFRFAHAPVRLNSFIKSDVHRDPTASDSPPRRDSDDSVTPDDGLTATEDLTWSYFAEETNPLLAEAAAAVNANANAANADAANADANAPAGDTPRSVAARLLRAQPAVALLPTAVGLDRSKRIKIETTFSLENNTLEEQSSVRLWAAEHFQGETMLKVAVHRSARDFVTLRQGLEYKLARTAAVARGGADELPELPPWIAKLANFKPIQRDARRFATAASVGAIGLVGVSVAACAGGMETRHGDESRRETRGDSCVVEKTVPFGS
ncbi:C2 domain-containing protein [Pelagophyceae sp. CCMP2097]|nr:C2 domain-containing protein [Pelagophyceae sp. CCMP2097]